MYAGLFKGFPHGRLQGRFAGLAVPAWLQPLPEFAVMNQQRLRH